MDWDKLRVFHAVAEAGSFTHAGDTLNLSQSAVSRQISALEEALAVPLFHRHARGLICLAMTCQRVGQLGLPLMAQANGTRHQTAFTVSIEAAEGVTTGISAFDRAHTIAAAINPELKPGDIVTPGHVFPLAARDGGTPVSYTHLTLPTKA